MAGTPKLTPKQWADIRQVWETDPREGYAWLIEALELSVSKVAIRKRAISEGWQKDDPQAEIVQAAILADKRAERREQEKERAAKAAKVSGEQGFPAETIKKPRKKTSKPNADNGLGEGVGGTTPETINPAGNLETEPGNLEGGRAETLGNHGSHRGKQSKHLHRGVNGGESDMPEQGGDPDASASVSDDPGMPDGHGDEQWQGEEGAVSFDDLEVSDCRDVALEGAASRKGFGGSQSGYRDEFAGQARRLCMLLNATDEQLCGFFEIGMSTLYIWRKENPAFLHAIKEGRIGADARVAESLYRRAVGMAIPKTVVTSFQGGVTLTDIHEYLPPDVGAARLWLNNRQPEHWKDNPEPPQADPKSMYPKPEELDVIYDQSVTLSRKRADVALDRMERLGLMGSMREVASDVEEEEKPRDWR